MFPTSLIIDCCLELTGVSYADLTNPSIHHDDTVLHARTLLIGSLKHLTGTSNPEIARLLSKKSVAGSISYHARKFDNLEPKVQATWILDLLTLLRRTSPKEPYWKTNLFPHETSRGGRK